MPCQHLTSHNEPCGNLIQKFNACGVHQHLADNLGEKESPSLKATFEKFITRYQQVMVMCKNLNISDNHTIAVLQRVFGWNIIPIKDIDLPSDPYEQSFATFLQYGCQLIRKYQHKLNPRLVHNTAQRIQREILG